MRHRVPDETVKRLPVYLREVTLLLNEGKKKVSSNELAEFLEVNSAQIRKDLSYFGTFGTRGVGYDTLKLTKQISKILKLNKQHKVVLVGVGNLGTAIMAYAGLGVYGFSIEAAFDNDTRKIGKKVNRIVIEDIAKLRSIRSKRIQMAVLAVTSEQAQQVADDLVSNGIKGILNFSPCRIEVPKNVKVVSIDIALDMARLPYYISTT